MLEVQLAYITKAKNQTKEEFIAEHGENMLNVWEALQKAKAGDIYITKISSNLGYLSKGESERGWTPAFGEGIACYIDNIDSYYYTSVIESINWEDHTFKTRNSTYKFIFYERKNQETE